MAQYVGGQVIARFLKSWCSCWSYFPSFLPPSVLLLFCLVVFCFFFFLLNSRKLKRDLYKKKRSSSKYVTCVLLEEMTLHSQRHFVRSILLQLLTAGLQDFMLEIKGFFLVVCCRYLFPCEIVANAVMTTEDTTTP